MTDTEYKHITCPNCNSSSLVNLIEYSKHFLTKCRNCSFVFSYKIPTKTETDSVYHSYGRDDYLSPITIKRYNEILDNFEKYRKTNRILDIGCGIGYFLETAKKRGWEVYGSEFTDEAIEICEKKGIIMLKGELTNDSFNSKDFDIVSAFEVIEHVSFPKEIISAVYQKLRPGGAFYFTTPNFNSIVRRKLKENWDVIAYPEHLSYFTKQSVDFLLKKQKFKRIKIQTHGISFSRLRSSKSENKEKYISEQSTDEKLRTSIEKSKIKRSLKEMVNWLLSVLALGDTLKGLYVKKA